MDNTLTSTASFENEITSKNALPRSLVKRFFQNLLRLIALLIVRSLYRVKSRGWENLPREGGAVLIANHVSYMDAVLLALASPRPVRFLSHDSFQNVPVLGTLLRLAEVIPVSNERSRDAVRVAVEHARRGEIVGIFPEGHLTRDGRVHDFQRGYELIARRAGVPVVPVCLDGLWGSIFSFERGKFFWKRPRRVPYRVTLSVGPALDPTVMTPDSARQTIIDLGADAFASRPELDGHLGATVLQSLLKNPSRDAVVDYAQGRKAVNAGTFAALALCLADKFRREIPENRVGIVLPPGLGGALTNVAVCLAGKTPVNLNFSLGRAALESCLARAEVETIISAAAVRTKIDAKFPDFPWTDKVIDISEVITGLPKAKIIGWLLAGKLLPASTVAKLAKVPTEGGDREAALLFTSGSSGEPKGVILTHRNLIGNCRQVISSGLFPKNAKLLGNLPIFHSFGFTTTIWLPLLESLQVVYTPSPLDFKLAAKAVEQERIDVMLGAPTFYRPYLTRVEPSALASLKAVVAGAEKTPAGFHEAWEARFPGCRYLEGYGLTETTPVVAVNIPPSFLPPGPERHAGMKAGSVGRLFPGMAAEVADPETGAILPVGQTGILRLKGANIFAGYLGEPERTAEVLHDGWLTTGDLARLDADGFLYIEGRLSRFSKIGGEMVPHGSVETAIAKAYGVDTAETPQVAIAAVSDPAKGEALVLITAIDINPVDLREKLSAAGLPNLWIPRDIRRVDHIPTLASGKLELGKLKELAAG